MLPLLELAALFRLPFPLLIREYHFFFFMFRRYSEGESGCCDCCYAGGGFV